GRQILGGKGEKRFQRLLALDGFEKVLDRQRHDGFLGAFGHQFVAIDGEDRQDLSAVSGRKGRAGGAHGNLALGGWAAGAKVSDNFGTKDFHYVPASNLVG